MKGKILVTGGTGYIGSHTTVELINAGYEVISMDNLSNSNIEVLDGIEAITGIRPKFYEADCNDEAAVERIFSENPGIVGLIHFAASKAVGESVQKPLLYYRNNLLSLIVMLEAMERHGTKGIVFSSSCTVYGQPEVLPVTENAPVQEALSPYGNTKQINEEILRDAIYAGAPYKAIRLRYFNPIGAHSSALIGELPLGVPQNLIPYLTQTAAGIRQELSVFGDDYNTPDGSCIRDYINVVDLAKAHVIAIERILDEDKQSEPLETFNIGTGRGVSVLELINTFEQVTGVKVPHKIVGRREGDIEQVWANPKHANEVLGWEAKETLADTLKSAWAWQERITKKA
ncbi:UDP-glucose 4-epimerase GalE [Porphyromonas sp. COT-290 OH3588]|uniref:UDP-glucose 4-epimerase GalE n=1 Tax=Porphyromonas sp. COT-290 OH3588 TaxID=1515617 RepID=UPI00052CD71F|nr:UDP-glucose 4-epimerase GalE [Porphyromonas sp. COT-290 OH3588]KGO00760.1 UDP-galactose-4-epimerase [Porphyromonas sp. COT-290 OH3588]